MRSEAVLARLFALRALVVFICSLLLLASLASGAWAEGGAAPEVEPAGATKSGALTLRQDRVSREIDGWLNVIVDDEGRVVRILSEGLVWRLEIGSAERPDPQAYVFSIRPAAEPVSEPHCGAGELCPAGFSAAATSRLVILEPLRAVTGVAGEPVYRQNVKLVLPFDVTWVDFQDAFRAAVATACRDAFAAERAAGRSIHEQRHGFLDPQLTFTLKAAVFSGARVAESDLAIHLRCWGGGFKP